LGAALGEELGSYCFTQRFRNKVFSGSSVKLAQSSLPVWYAVEDSEASQTQHVPSTWGKLAIQWAEELIEQGQWRGLKKHQVEAFVSNKNNGESLPSEPIKPLFGAEIAIATLPITLFFHDNEIKLQQIISEITGHLEISCGFSEVWVFSYTIAQALKEQLSPAHFIPQIVADLQQNISSSSNSQSLHSSLILKLEQVQTWLQEGVSLSTVASERLLSKEAASGTDAICLALYCFLSTPNDFRLALNRAALLGSSAQIVSGLTGALLGAYNCTVGVPLAWRLKSINPSHILAWGVTSATIEQLAAQLLSVWSGVYDLANPSGSVPAIAAPGIIRLR
jgi:ADP-ribosylglycohydrolase